MKKANLKNNSSKKKFRFKIVKFLFLVVVVYFTYALTLKYLIKNNIDITDEKYVSFLVNEAYKKDNKYSFIVNESLRLVSGIDLKNPYTILDSKMKVSKEEAPLKEVVKDATAGSDEYDSSVYEKITSYISNPDTSEVVNPEIYIYNTHQLETYANTGLENSNITPNIMMTSYLLKEKLNKLGVKTVVEDTNMSEFIRVSNLENNEPYSVSRIFINNIRTKYPSLKYFIDIHRDSVSKEISTCTINNKNYARILFVVGTTNPTYKENESLARKLDDISDKLYPCMSRGVYMKETKGWTPAYNQDLSGNSMLIEVGAKENTIDEVLNTVDALSNVIKYYIKGE